AFTIHKKIYRKRTAVSADMSFQLAPNLAENTLFIVDEASMITDETNQSGSSLLRDLLEHVYQPGAGGRYKNCFLLFVGDTAQLPPVGTMESPALNSAYLQIKFTLNITEIELKEVVRQEQESGILANATLLRRSILKKDPIKIPVFKTKGYTDIFRMNGGKLAEGLEYAYKKFGIEQSLVVCRSNKSANIYNNHIRAQLLYREEELTGGDQIMIVKNNYFWLPDNNEADFIANGDMARIIKVRGEEERYGLRFTEVQLELLDFPEAGIITCKVILDTLSAETPNLPQEKAQKLFEGVSLDHEHIKSKPLRMKAIKDDPYYNALQIKFAYAVTCHKAQGGQWDAVFVDQGFLNTEMIDLDFLRWLYTAVTRARSELFLVNFADAFFKGTIEA
ncbi:MAG: ATP-dependent endonuclease, partial [Sphingobacteriales bacterium]